MNIDEYIKYMERVYKRKEDELKDIKSRISVALVQRLQLEWIDNEDYFRDRYLMQPVSYSIVRKSAEDEKELVKSFEALNNIFKKWKK